MDLKFCTCCECEAAIFYRATREMELRQDDKGESDKGSPAMRRTNEGVNVTLKDIPQVILHCFVLSVEILFIVQIWTFLRVHATPNLVDLLLGCTVSVPLKVIFQS